MLTCSAVQAVFPSSLRRSLQNSGARLQGNQDPRHRIGAGRYVDGQVLVLHDMLGITMDFSPRFLRRYANLSEEVQGSVTAYINDVKSLDFPNEREQY